MSDIPNSALISDLFQGRYKAQIVQIAMGMDLFSKMGDGVLDVFSLAERCDCHPQGMRLLLNYLVSLGLVNRETHGYSLSATGAFYLVPARNSYTGKWITSETDPQIWQGIADAVRDGKPVYLDLPFASEAWMAVYESGQLSKVLSTWEALGINPRRLRDKRILDLACGSGVKTLALALADSSVRLTMVDSEDVLKATQYLVEKLNLSGQTRLAAGDALTVKLEPQSFELVFIGQITYYWSEAQNRALFTRLHDVIVPGGTLIIEAAMPDNQNAELISMYSLLLWANVGTCLHSYEEYHIWMKDAGFTNVRRRGPLVVMGDREC